jgi:hypothetical protein
MSLREKEGCSTSCAAEEKVKSPALFQLLGLRKSKADLVVRT